MAIRDISLALIAFYRAEEGISSATRANSVLMDLRMRYQREVRQQIPFFMYSFISSLVRRVLLRLSSYVYVCARYDRTMSSALYFLAAV